VPQGQLNRRRAHAATGTENQRRFTAARRAGLEHAHPGREEDHRNGRRLHRRERIGVAIQVVAFDDHIACVAAMAEERHGPIALAPTLNLGADPQNYAGSLQARAIWPRRDRTIQPGPQQQVGEIDPDGFDAKMHFPRAGVGQRQFSLHQHLRGAVPFYQDRTRA
jgi:hypothetical protein